jgi:hypothetical protein
VVPVAHMMVGCGGMPPESKTVPYFAVILPDKGQNAAEQREFTKVRRETAPEISGRSAFNAQETKDVIHKVMNRDYKKQHILTRNPAAR